jgi:archaellum component FlaC
MKEIIKELILDSLIKEYTAIEKKISTLTDKKEALRKEIFGYVEDNGLTDGYKNALATVSYVNRKIITVKDELALISELHDQKIVKYVQEIPAHLELTKKFTDDVKAGEFTHPLVEVEEKPNLAIKINK